MFERYTERARRTLFFARYEASQLGSISIEPEHLLLGISREGKGVVGRILARAHLSLDNLRSEIEHRVAAADRVSTSVEIPFSEATKRVLQQAAVEADGLGHSEIGVEHLFLGLLAAVPNGAASWLIDKGLRLEGARQEVRRLRDETAAHADRPEAADELQVRTRISPFADRQPGRPNNSKPDVWPSYDVHISPASQPTATRSTRGPGFWAVYGFTLRRLLADLYDIDEGRIELPATHADDARFDIVAVTPNLESPATMTRLVQQAIERHFGIAFTLEPRAIDVYVLTAASSQLQDIGGGRAHGFLGAFALPTNLQGTVNEQALAQQLMEVIKAGRDILTGASTGTADVYIRRTRDLPEDLVAQLADRPGIIATPGRRMGLMLVGRLREG